MDEQARKLTSGGQPAKRSLLLRGAKVVCASGEYICLIRDVSARGAALSFLHDAPPDTRIILVLANGLTYPIERLWEGRKQAGYRFVSPISVGEFMHESVPYEVRPIRLAIKAPVRIIDGRSTYIAQLLDLSTHGAKFECNAQIPCGRLVSFQIAGLAQFLGEVRWSGNGSQAGVHGFRFSNPMPLRELAAAALRLQPLPSRVASAFAASFTSASAA